MRWQVAECHNGTTLKYVDWFFICMNVWDEHVAYKDKWVTDILSQKEGIFPPMKLMSSNLYVDISSHTAWTCTDKSKIDVDILDVGKGKFRGSVTTLLQHQLAIILYICLSFQGTKSCNCYGWTVALFSYRRDYLIFLSSHLSKKSWTDFC